MKDIIPATKQSPILGLSGLGGGVGSNLGGSLAEKTYVDDIFSTYLHKGTGAAKTIVNGVDLTEGGLVWQKCRNLTQENIWIDSERGLDKFIRSNAANGNNTASTSITSFNNNGFTTGSYGDSNQVNQDYATWTFRKAPGFFDCFTFTGDNTTSRNISHNLGSLPGFIIIKRTDGNGNWYCVAKYGSSNYGIGDNSNDFTLNSDSIPQVVRPFATIATSTTINVAKFSATNSGYDHTKTNASGATYVCYMWAMGNSDAEIFGEDEDRGVIKCGEYTSNTNLQDINLGFEPQWIMVKKISGTGYWYVFDAMRGVASEQGTTSAGKDMSLYPNVTLAEDGAGDGNKIDFLPNGFRLTGNLGSGNSPINGGGDYMYVAIRRPDGYVGKPPSAGTDVFKVVNDTNTTPRIITPFPVDMALYKHGTLTETFFLVTRMTSSPETGRILRTSNNNAESNSGLAAAMDYSDGWINNANNMANYVGWNWKRYSGFDVVAYAGNGSTKTVNHSLGRVPEMIWIKARNDAQNWLAYHKGLNGGTTPWNYHIILNSTGAEGAFSFINQPTTTNFAVTSAWQASNKYYVAMLFASVDGISKVGSYTGNGTVGHAITVGFQPRFLLVKAATTTTGWYVFDTTRGWGAGNDASLQLQSTAGVDNSTDYGAPTSTGFTINITGNAMNGNGEKYIYYAHA